MILVSQRGPLVYTHEYNGTLLRVYEHKGPPCIYVKYEKNLAYSMALRDSIANGLAEIRETAEELILDLQIELQIKNAVVRHETSIFVELPSGTNLFVIHREMIKQIEDEGFHVEYRQPCCEEPDMFPLYEDDEDTGYECDNCDDGTSYSKPLYGSIEISWNHQ